MADKTGSSLPKVSFEQRRAAAGQYERAQQVLAAGNFDYGIQLLRNCCQLDPANFIFRQALRQAQRDKYKDNRRGQTMAALRTLPARLRMQTASKGKNPLKVLEHAEDILTRNPWDVGALMAMGDVFDHFDLLQHALWSVDLARQVHPKSIPVNRRLAQLLEKAGSFAQAIKLWEFVRQAVPTDLEAQHKSKDLAASDTIARGKFADVIEGSAKSPAGFSGPVEKPKKNTVQPEETDVAVPMAEERGGKDIAAILAKIESHPTVANNYLHLAGIHRRNDDIDKAREILQQGLVPSGNNFDIAMELMDLEIETFRRNLEIAETKLARTPDDAELKKMRARLLKEINTRELDYFRQKADRYPNETSHKYEVGVRLLHVGQPDEAIKELQAIRNDPRYRTQALYYLGFCFKQRNNWRLAQRNFEEALQNLVTGETDMRKEILFQLATGFAAANELSRAVDLGCELANLDYAYKDIGKLLDEWQNRLQKA